MPHRYLADYEWSLYVDGNARLNPDAVTLLEGYKSAAFVSFRHPDRDCLYDEAEHIIREDYDDERRVREQIDLYRESGFPAHAGLIAGTVLFRRHNDPEVIALGEEWYEHVLRFSKRDQLSFNYVAWRRRFAHSFFRGSLRENDYVTWPAHSRDKRVTADFDPAVYAWLNPEVEESGLSPPEHFLRARQAGRKAKKYKRHSWELRKLANKYRSDKGDIYFNAHGYADIYETLLRDRRDEPLRLLELGLLRHDVQARNPGGPYAEAPSLAMWREYFPNAMIYGFDIGDFSAVPPMSRVEIIRGDMGNPFDLEMLVAKTGGEFDLILDDASHASHHQQIALAFLFPHLRLGGIYFVEDLQYQPPALEEADAVKTLGIFKALACGNIKPTQYIDRKALEDIAANLVRIELFDSCDRTFGKLNVDALAALWKGKPQRKKTTKRKGLRWALRRTLGL